MGQGLGKNSPVQLSLGRENYEALLSRHGQWTRWRIANKCACVNKQTQQPDIHCKICGGRGVFYSVQPQTTVQCVVMAKDDSGILILDDDYINDTLVKVYDRNGKEYNADKQQSFIIILDGVSIVKGTYFNILLKRDSLQTLESSDLTCSNGYYTIESLINEQAKTDGVYYSSPSDIISIESIIDSAGQTFSVDEYRLNKILLKEKTEETTDEDGNTSTTTITPTLPLTAYNVKYIEPYIFAVLNQNLSKSDFNAMTEASGDAIVTFEYSCDVAENDVLTVLAGTITQKDVISHTSGVCDKLPAFFVESVVSVYDSNGQSYTEGVDYVLYGTNGIKWLDDIFEIGDSYSVTYRAYPTYKVIKNIPQLRSSENQRFPKKAIVKYMTSYNESSKINRQ